MKDIKKIYPAIYISIVFFLTLIILWFFRYENIVSTNGIMYQVNRFTGDIKFIRGLVSRNVIKVEPIKNNDDGLSEEKGDDE